MPQPSNNKNQVKNYQTILFEVAEGVARLTLNRPDKLNSFTGTMHFELRDAIDSIQADKSIRVLVIAGAGRAFVPVKTWPILIWPWGPQRRI